MNNKAVAKKFCLLILLITINSMAMTQKYKSVNEAKGIQTGDSAPMFTAQDQFNNSFSLSKALEKGPVVVLFYRGQWCPVCNRHLSQLQDSLQQIYDMGATVVAISPEKPEYLKMTKEKTHASFTLLFDKDYIIEDAFDVTFNPDSLKVEMYNNKLNAQLNKAHSGNSNRLPIPATFIINKKGIIIWRQFNPDYRIRASVKEIINNIPSN